MFLEFNPQYNAIIGGRGSGKSTILEYLRWALCDVPTGESEGMGFGPSDHEERRQSLIARTLAPYSAVVQVNLMINGVRHAIRRNAGSGEIALKIGDAAFEKCVGEDVRRLLPIHAYSQKELSGVAVRVEELRALRLHTDCQ